MKLKKTMVFGAIGVAALVTPLAMNLANNANDYSANVSTQVTTPTPSSWNKTIYSPDWQQTSSTTLSINDYLSQQSMTIGTFYGELNTVQNASIDGGTLIYNITEVVYVPSSLWHGAVGYVQGIVDPIAKNLIAGNVPTTNGTNWEPNNTNIPTSVITILGHDLLNFMDSLNSLPNQAYVFVNTNVQGVMKTRARMVLIDAVHNNGGVMTPTLQKQFNYAMIGSLPYIFGFGNNDQNALEFVNQLQSFYYSGKNTGTTTTKTGNTQIWGNADSQGYAVWLENPTTGGSYLPYINAPTYNASMATPSTTLGQVTMPTGLGAGAITGIVIGSIAGLIIIIGGVSWIVYDKKKKALASGDINKLEEKPLKKDKK